MAAHYFKCDFEVDEKARMRCPACKSSDIMAISDSNFTKFMETTTAEEVSQLIMDFLIASCDTAFDSYRMVLKSCLRSIQRHCQRNKNVHGEECFEPAYFVHLIEFAKNRKPISPTKKKTEDGLFYGYKLLEADSTEDRRIPLWIIDPDYRPIDPRLQKRHAPEKTLH